MLVSALLTSVGINLGLCSLYLTLYSILRKQPGNANIYAPRLAAEGKAQRRTNFDIEMLLPTIGWVRRAWQISEEDLLSKSGLDAVVFMRIFTFSIKVFVVAGIAGIFILLPINYAGNELNGINFSDLPHKSLDLFSISNVDDGSKRLWVHFSVVYFITAVVCYLLFVEYKYITSKRVAFFSTSKPQPHQFTILVRGIPSSTSGSFSDSVEKFFTEYHSSTYLSHLMVHRTSELHNLITEAKKIYKKLMHLKSGGDKQKIKRDGFMGLFGRKVDIVDHHEKKLGDLEEKVRKGQHDVSFAEGEVPAAFVSFKSTYGAATAALIPQSDNPTEWITDEAPEPRDVNWTFFSTSFIRMWFSWVVVVWLSLLLTLLFLIPVVFVQGLTNLNQLKTWFPFLKGILTITFVSSVITGYLPSLILQMFLNIIPPIMMIFSSMQGYISHSEVEKSACSKVLWFTVWNIFFANVLSGSVLYQLNTFLELKNIPRQLAIAVPGQASFFIAYVVTSGWTSLSSEVFRMLPLILSTIKKVAGCHDSELNVPSLPYYSEIPRVLFFGLLGLSYVILAPLILPFLLVYYSLGYIIYRNQLLNVYEAKYETAGKFWPIVHNSTIFSLILMQAIAIGIFGLKKLSLASTLTIPLLVLTLLFNQYCGTRFLPMFRTYSAETLIKKDREDEKDPALQNFLDKLVTAYKDPALMPIRYSDNHDQHNTPLLSATEV